MLINQVLEGKDTNSGGSERKDTYEYETANELFEIMAKTHPFKTNDETLTASDLVVLYKNLDAGTKLMAEAKSSQTRPPNQYVETVVYKDDHNSDDSDVDEIYSSEDIRNVMMVNKERIDFLDNTTSFENTLCQKLGNITMKTSNLGTGYDKTFLFKDPYVKEQLNGFMPSMADTEVLPSSLLDYICCKRLEDNYNFYMDNIIKYVQHTIEQLKRISNGDYLTEKAKEKWRQVDQVHTNADSKSTILTKSVSIPVHVEQKVGCIKSTWDDVVRSEVDVRTLTKILEKKIVEIPKLICGTFKLFSKRCNDNLIISCKKDTNNLNEAKSRIDVVLKLKKSETGQIVSELNSIMILQTTPQNAIEDVQNETAPIMCKEIEDVKTINVEFDATKNEDESITNEFTYEHSLVTNNSPETYDDSFIGIDTDGSNASFPISNSYDFKNFPSYPTIIDNKSYSDEQTEANFRLMPPDELRCNLQRLNMNSPVPEESAIPNKKKSSTRVRIKSPYENSSHAIEERKRKRLLEIRERRELKKKLLNENRRLLKHKYGRSAVSAQATYSVTNLSISNKSFYNSIYGEAMNIEAKKSKRDPKLQNQDLKIVVELEKCEDDLPKESPRSPSNKEKYINHSYYLDNAETEIMHLENKKKLQNNCTASSSAVSEDFVSSVSLLNEIMNLSNPATDEISIEKDRKEGNIESLEIEEGSTSLISPQKGVSNTVLQNSPKESSGKLDINEQYVKPALECRKSIDKVYDLIKRSTKETSPSDQNNHVSVNVESEGKVYNPSLQPSDSGTSLKHNIASSTPSYFSFDKTDNELPQKKKINKKSEIPVSTTTKTGSTSAKGSGVGRLPEDKHKKDRRRATSPGRKPPENPLKAISQLLHQFENVQNRHKQNDKKHDGEKKNHNRQVSFKKPIQNEVNIKESHASSRVSTPKDKKSRVNTLTTPRTHNRPTIEEKPIEKFHKKKVTDILDEVKEARGEAVRGPPKSRIDSLALPKKPYQQNPEQLLNRIRGFANKHQRPTHNAPADRKETLNLTRRQRKVSETNGPQKPHSTVPPLGGRRSASTSPDGNRNRSPVPAKGPSYKSNVSEAPEKLHKKMVAVESYVKNHYGRTSPTRDIKDFFGAQKSRAPLIPNDLDIGSIASSRTAEESAILGKKLHNMIDTMISSTVPALSSLCEQIEISRSNDTINDAFIDNTTEQYEEIISNTEYPIDVFGDKSITTAVSTLPKDNENLLKNNTDLNVVTYDIHPFNSLTELARLENALYRRLSASTFQKRLRIKNLTLTPKHSLQQVVVLQSGDVGSLVVKSTHSQNVIRTNQSKIMNTNPKEEEQNKQTETKSHVDWTFSKFPVQMLTVGFSVSNMPENISIAEIEPNNGTSSGANTSNRSRSANYCDKSKKPIRCDKEKARHKKESALQCDINDHLPYSITLEEFENLKKNSGLSVKDQENIKCNSLQKTVETPKDSKKDINININNSESKNKPEIIDNSNSLDILVGLLNEIKNITTCQTHLTENKIQEKQQDLKELEFILKKAEFQEHSVDQSPQNVLSISSLNNELYNNFCKIYMPSPTNIISMNPVRIDKEVNVNFSVEYQHAVTDVPSVCYPLTEHHSTNVTNSLFGIISEPSEQSLYYFSDYNTLYCNSSFNKIIELPNVEKKNSCHSLLPVLKEDKEKKVLQRKISRQVTNIDPLIKVKRDILVTIYSLLVMTVFAALSFPELFYR